MPTFDNESGTPKTARKRAAAGASSENPAPKRATTKKSAPARPDVSPLLAKKAAKTSDAVVTAAAKTGTATAVPTSAPQAATPAPSTPSTPVAGSHAPRPVPMVTGRFDPAIAKVVGADERRRMIAEAAYHKFLQRGPGQRTPTQDWMEAEAEIDALLAEQESPRTQ